MSMSEREKRLLLITGIVAISAILLLGWKYLSSEVTDTQVSEATAERFDDLFTKIKNVESQKDRNLILRKKLGNETGLFVKEDEVMAMVAEIDRLAQQSQVQMKNWDPSINTRAKPFPQLNLKLTLECRFENLVQFLQVVRQAKYICQVTTLRAKLKDPNKPELDVSMTLMTYLIDSKTQAVSVSQELAQK